MYKYRCGRTYCVSLTTLHRPQVLNIGRPMCMTLSRASEGYSCLGYWFESSPGHFFLFFLFSSSFSSFLFFFMCTISMTVGECFVLFVAVPVVRHWTLVLLINKCRIETRHHTDMKKRRHIRRQIIPISKHNKNAPLHLFQESVAFYTHRTSWPRTQRV